MSRRCLSLAACRTWLSPQDVVRLALRSYYAACRDLEPPPGTPFLDPEHGPWAGRESLREGFLATLDRAVHAHARHKGLQGYESGPDDTDPGVQGQSPRGGALDPDGGEGNSACGAAPFEGSELASAAPPEDRAFLRPAIARIAGS
jgi:hypothetical protein